MQAANPTFRWMNTWSSGPEAGEPRALDADVGELAEALVKDSGDADLNVDTLVGLTARDDRAWVQAERAIRDVLTDPRTCSATRVLLLAAIHGSENDSLRARVDQMLVDALTNPETSDEIRTRLLEAAHGLCVRELNSALPHRPPPSATMLFLAGHCPSPPGAPAMQERITQQLSAAVPGAGLEEPESVFSSERRATAGELIASARRLKNMVAWDFVIDKLNAKVLRELGNTAKASGKPVVAFLRAGEFAYPVPVVVGVDGHALRLRDVQGWRDLDAQERGAFAHMLLGEIDHRMRAGDELTAVTRELVNDLAPKWIALPPESRRLAAVGVAAQRMAALSLDPAPVPAARMPIIATINANGEAVARPDLRPKPSLEHPAARHEDPKLQEALDPALRGLFDSFKLKLVLTKETDPEAGKPFKTTTVTPFMDIAKALNALENGTSRSDFSKSLGGAQSQLGVALFDLSRIADKARQSSSLFSNQLPEGSPILVAQRTLRTLGLPDALIPQICLRHHDLLGRMQSLADRHKQLGQELAALKASHDADPAAVDKVAGKLKQAAENFRKAAGEVIALREGLTRNLDAAQRALKDLAGSSAGWSDRRWARKMDEALDTYKGQLASSDLLKRTSALAGKAVKSPEAVIRLFQGLPAPAAPNPAPAAS